MADASDIHGVVFKNGSATLLARVVDNDGIPLVPSQVTSAAYTIYLLEEDDPDAGTAVVGHTDVAVDVPSLVLDTLKTDPLWDIDQAGYNFTHILDVSSGQAFAIAGRTYRVVFRLMPNEGQVILVRFRVHAI